MDDVAQAVDQLAAEQGYSGVVRIDEGDRVVLAQAYGAAHRGWGIANQPDTRFGLASGAKGLTALAVMSLVEDGRLERSTTARSVLGPDLPLIDDAVTVEQLLAHRSGIGDYLDEDDPTPITDHVLSVPVHTLADTEDYLAVLDGYPSAFAPDERFAYCNGGFVVLALIAERASGTPFHQLVAERVCRPAGMDDTAFLRSDELPGGVALGYLFDTGDLTNLLHLPVRGSGDGGVYSTVADVHSFWRALFDGRIVPAHIVAEMTAPRSEFPEDHRRYGLGFWLHATGPAVMLEGYDAGVSFRTTHDPVSGRTFTVVSNWTDGAWPLVRYLADTLT
jgi:CubicO group peptidase (beta-lactamase class C family)